MDFYKPPDIPMASPDLTSAEIKSVMEVLESPSLSMGPKQTAFEEAVAAYAGTRHAVGVSSGTAGLHLCIHAAGISDGDYVITTPFSFVASTNVILFERAVPILVDVDPLTGNIDTTKVKLAADALATGGKEAQRWLPRKGASPGGKLKALLPVDVFGQPADMDPLQEVADRHGLQIIEDSCEALGASYKGRAAGSLGDYGVFAFYPNKQITTGEGGMIVTDDGDAADLMRSLRNQGRAVGDTWLQHTRLGYNYRMTELSAALGVAQMSRLEELLTSRAKVAGWYGERLREVPGVEIPHIAPETSFVSWFVYVIRLAPGINRDEVAQKLAAKGIPVRPYFVPIHLQPYMVERFGYKEGDFPVTEDLGQRGMAIPFSGKMTEAQVDQVCRALKECAV